MTSKEMVLDYIRLIKHNLRIACNEGYSVEIERLQQELDWHETILKDLEILEEIRNDFKVIDWGEYFQNRYELIYQDWYRVFINKEQFDKWSRWLNEE